jgi:hypothetical protein
VPAADAAAGTVENSRKLHDHRRRRRVHRVVTPVRHP